MPLPDFLVDRYKEWKTNSSEKEKKLYKDLSKNGQKPRCMIISCSDSRVVPEYIFNSKIGEYFSHRNIANLVPATKKINNDFSTIAAIEYAVKSLKIPNILILGHSNCGGIKYAYEKFSNSNSNLNSSYIDNWISIVEPSFKKLNKKLNKNNCITSLEKLSIITSIKNLKKLPFIDNLIKDGKLNVYGMWFEIKSRKLMYYDENKNKFLVLDQ